MSKEERLRHIIEELYAIAHLGQLKDTLWKAYQSVCDQPDALDLRIEGIEETLFQLTLQIKQVQS